MHCVEGFLAVDKLVAEACCWVVVEILSDSRVVDDGLYACRFEDFGIADAGKFEDLGAFELEYSSVSFARLFVALFTLKGDEKG